MAGQLTPVGANMQMHGKDMQKQAVPIIDAMIAAVDGERDPRCLMLAFQCIQHMADLYLQGDESCVQARNLWMLYMRHVINVKILLTSWPSPRMLIPRG